jgi:hypothetical protein
VTRTLLETLTRYGPAAAAPALVALGALANLLIAPSRPTCVALGIMAIPSRAQRRPMPAVFESALIALTYLPGGWARYGVGRS